MVALVALQLVGNPQEGAVEQRAIIIGEFDQLGFDNEPSQLNELARALAALDLPFACARSSLHCFKPIPHDSKEPCHSPRRDQLALQLCVARVAKSTPLPCSSPPPCFHLTS